MLVGKTIQADVPIVVTRRDVFDELIERRLDEAYRLAGVILGDASDAEDAVHNAALAAWRSRHLLRDEARMEAWFTRIVVNACRDRLRARRRHRVVELDADAGARISTGTPGDDQSGYAVRDMVGRALAVLEPDELIVVVLRYYRDLPVDAIAERVGIPPGERRDSDTSPDLLSNPRCDAGRGHRPAVDRRGANRRPVVQPIGSR